MTVRKAFPRSRRHHELAAGEVLQTYVRRCGWTPQLPVPVEHILEACFDLRIVWDELEEPPEERILGALDPATRTVYLNERQMELFEKWIGPEAFTLAHELGHWIYDAVNPNQQQLIAVDGGQVFCRTRSDSQRPSDIREVNANGFAAALLLPEHLVRAELTAPFSSYTALAETAARWGVSRTTLAIRLQTLGLGVGAAGVGL